MRQYLIALALLAGLPMAQAQHSISVKDQPAHGPVPDEATAIRIAIAVWEPIYGKEAIARQAPHHAHLKDGVWTVSGSLPPGSRGGTAIARIAKGDGGVLQITHGK